MVQMQSNQASATQTVHLEFQRVQTWLFAVPRLRAMVGANALLGEALRDKLPALARRTDRGWMLAPSHEADAYPSARLDDPLKQYDDVDLRDDPASDALKGILSRDGGHFVAQFESGAEAFAEAAAAFLHQELPGLRFCTWLNDIEQPHLTGAHLPIDLPVLEPCQWTGRGLASDYVQQGNKNDEDYEELAVSLDVKRRHSKAIDAERWKTVDMATLLAATTKLRDFERERVKELKALVDDGYLALVHADGNGVGKNKPKGEAASARFFHDNRVLLRRALQVAVDAACTEGTKQAPLIPLMLGGDDVLLVCRAELALPFVVSLCEELDRLQPNKTSAFTLTLGVGVVIAKHTIPINRLHEVVEQLASSAKRRFRGLAEAGNQGYSVVDWAAYTTSWIDNPEAIRRRDWVRGEGQEQRVLSQRPLSVLGSGLNSLQGLVAGAEKLKCAPRSQLRYLVDQLPRGRALSELAFAELSKAASEALAEAGVRAPWRSDTDKAPWRTELLDLVEVLEMFQLGCKAERRDSHDAEPTGEVASA